MFKCIRCGKTYLVMDCEEIDNLCNPCRCEAFKDDNINVLKSNIPEEVFQMLENIENRRPKLAAQIIWDIRTLWDKYGNVKLLENNELYFFKGKFVSNGNESIVLTPLFFLNNKYYMENIHDQSDLDFNLIESDLFLQKVFLMEQIDDITKLINITNEGICDGWNDHLNNLSTFINEKFYEKCKKQYETEFEMDCFTPIGYGTSFLEKVSTNKITLQNLYEIEKNQIKRRLR